MASGDDPLEGYEGASAQLERSPAFDFHGPPGSVLLFNSSSLHAAHCRAKAGARKSVQVYYRRLSHDGGPIAHATVVPTWFWRDAADAEVRQFYGAEINERTRVYAEAFAPPREEITSCRL